MTINYILYMKNPRYDKRFGALSIRQRRYGVGLMYASLINDLERAKSCADQYVKANPDFECQVRPAGKGHPVYSVKGDAFNAGVNQLSCRTPAESEEKQ